MRCPVLLMLLSVILAAAPAAAAPAGGVTFQSNQRCAMVENGQVFDFDAFTLAAWVKLDRTGGSQVFLNRGEPNQLFTFYLYEGRIRMLVRNAAEKYSHASAPAPQPGVWVHYAGSYDGQQIKLYVNGRLADTVAAPGRMAKSSEPLYLGANSPGVRTLAGQLEDVRIWSRVLSDEEVARVANSESGGDLDKDLVARWTADSLEGDDWHSATAPALTAVMIEDRVISREKVDGYRGIWYSNQKQDDEYVYKYSGGLGTYCAKHRPFAIYRPEVNKTFFCYGGTNPEGTTLLHMVSYYDHATGTVPRPTLLLDKHTTDAHDNPVISIDAEGYIWVFSSSHGTARPSFISKSQKPYSIDSFERVLTSNFSYTQPFYVNGKGFIFPQTIYKGGRAFYFQTSPDGRQWTEPTLLSLIDQGHYEISQPLGDKKLGSAFNYHPKGLGLNWRTNLYYIETTDFGKTWHNAAGEQLELPLTEPENTALVYNYQKEKRNVYMKDITFDADGHPVVLYVTSGGWQAGPANDPRIWQTARWTGTEWDIQGTIRSDNNYDMGSLYIEEDGAWRIIGPTQRGPQPYNPGGEVAMWTSNDQGKTWKMAKQLTRNSEYNHTYVRRPVDAQPDFYALWADGNARAKSDSRLYFTNRAGDHVWRLPVHMDGGTAKPEIAW